MSEVTRQLYNHYHGTQIFDTFPPQSWGYIEFLVGIMFGIALGAILSPILFTDKRR